jgi:hypothetical protein
VRRWSGEIDGRTWTLTTTLLSRGGIVAVLSSGGTMRIKNGEGAELGGAYVAQERDAPEYLGEKLVSDR